LCIDSPPCKIHVVYVCMYEVSYRDGVAMQYAATAVPTAFASAEGMAACGERRYIDSLSLHTGY
jgi:hypothetical protein